MENSGRSKIVPRRKNSGVKLFFILQGPSSLSLKRVVGLVCVGTLL